jgi:serine phosphatase RsbU (regulator of sigma subunit)
MQITWIDSHGGRTNLELEASEFLIGRGHRCRLRDHDDPILSRKHARLFLSDRTWRVADCGSRNRTYRNGHEVRMPEPILPGDTILAGHCRILIGGEDVTPVVTPADASSSERTLGSLDISGEHHAGTRQILVDAARLVAQNTPPEQIIESLLGLARHATRADRGLVALQRGDGTLTPIAWNDPTSPDPPRPSGSILSRVLREGKALAIRDVQVADDDARSTTLVAAGIRSVLCAPLGSTAPYMGVLYLDRRECTATFDDSHLQVVAVLAGMMQVVLENREARAHEQRLRSIEAELSAAARMQEMLLPPPELVPPPGFAIAGWHDPCHEIGGDVYDFFCSGRRFGTMVADVSGKGLTAALLVAGLHARWHAMTQLDLPCERMLSQLNQEISYRLPSNRFVTLAAALADPLHDELIFASAGHGPALLLRGPRAELLDPTGPPLGLLDGIVYECRRRSFHRGDTLIVFSDGVFDQYDESGDPFGLERLIPCAVEARSEGPRAIVRAIVHALERHAGAAEQTDDTTIAVLARV